MNHHRPPARGRLAALALVAGLAATSVLAGALWTFHGAEPGLPWAGLEASPAGVDPSCTAPDPRDRRCQRHVAEASATACAGSACLPRQGLSVQDFTPGCSRTARCTPMSLG